MPAAAAGLAMVGVGQALNMAITVADMNARTQKEFNNAAKNAI